MKLRNMTIGQFDGFGALGFSMFASRKSETSVFLEMLFHNDSTSAGFIFEIPIVAEKKMHLKNQSSLVWYS
jgi:hypothetical protein